MTQSPLLYLYQVTTQGSLKKLIRHLLTFQGMITFSLTAFYFRFLFIYRNEILVDFYSITTHHVGVIFFFLILFSIRNGLNGYGISLNLAEIQFLTVSPLQPQSILIYHFTQRIQSTAILSFFATLLFSNHYHMIYSLIFGVKIFTALLVLSSITLCFHSLCHQASTQKSQLLLRRFSNTLDLFLCLFLLSFMIAGFLAFWWRSPEPIQTLYHSTTIQMILLPGFWLNHILVLPGSLNTLYWLVLTSAIILLCFSVILRHFDFRSDSFQQFYLAKIEKQQESQHHGIQLHFKIQNIRWFNFSIRNFPSWSGTGPLIWRRIQELSRHFPYGLGLFFIALGYYGFLDYFMIQQIQTHRQSGIGPIELNFIGQVMAILIGLPLTAYDFKSDIHRLEWMKSLPIPLPSFVLGQTGVSILVITVFLSSVVSVNHCLLFYAFPDRDCSSIFAFHLWSLPLAVLTIFSGNILFMLTPVNSSQNCGQNRATSGLFQYFLGCTLVGTLTVFLITVIHCSSLISKHHNHPKLIFYSLTTSVFVLAALFAFRLTVWAYRRWDVSKMNTT